MVIVRPSEQRGHANHGWLDSYHTFSFADYLDPDWMGFGSLRVINEDRVAGGTGFGLHPHRDMEILTWVISGALAHEDNLGHRAVLRPGELQRISAGTGVEHSEHNFSPIEPVHFLQIWIRPARQGVQPAYEQRSFRDALARGGQVLLASGQPRPAGDALLIHQDARVWVINLAAGQELQQPLASDRRAWVHVVTGTTSANGQALRVGDAVGITQEPAVTLQASGPSQLLLFDLA